MEGSLVWADLRWTAYSRIWFGRELGGLGAILCRERRIGPAPRQAGSRAMGHHAAILLRAARPAAPVEGGTNDLAEIASMMGESVADLVLLAPEEDRANLLAHTVSALGQMVLEKSGAFEGGSNATH